MEWHMNMTFKGGKNELVRIILVCSWQNNCDTTTNRHITNINFGAMALL